MTITGTGSVSGSATADVTFGITNPTMTLAPATQTVNGTSGSAITATSALMASNGCGGSTTYAVTSGTLPAGLTLDPNTGIISGTPTETASTTVTITASDVTGPSRMATATVTFNIVLPPSLTPTTQTVTGLARCPITMTPPVAANFGGTVSYVSTSGIAPPGLTFSTGTGVFAGIPSADSSATVGIRGTGSVSGSATTQVTFAITDPAMTLTPATQSANGTVGTSITATSDLTTTNPCSTVAYTVTSGTLPDGLTLNASTGAITGTPTDISSATITITATDTTGPTRTATAVVIFDIVRPPLPAGVANLVTQPVATIPPTSTTAPPPTTLPSSTTTPPPTRTVPPTPVPAPQGDLPELGSTDTLVTENGEAIDVELVVENDEALVLRSQDFELRLRGACTTGCTITEDTTGRETIHLDRNGGARVSGFGFLPGSLVHVWIFSEPHYLGPLLVQPDGTYEGTFPLTDIEVGGHTLQANGTSFDNLPRSANVGIVVIDNTVPTPAPTALPATGSTTSGATFGAVLLILGAVLIWGGRRRRPSL